MMNVNQTSNPELVKVRLNAYNKLMKCQNNLEIITFDVYNCRYDTFKVLSAYYKRVVK